MKTSKVLREEMDALRHEAQGIYAAAQRSGREMSEEETKRFDEITNPKTGLIDQVKVQLDEAEGRERTIAEISQQEQRKRSLEQLDNLWSDRPNPVLPINGTLPENRTTDDNPRVHVRMAKLKAFKDEKNAYDAGMWFRAVIGREWNREDKQAELYCRGKGIAITNAANEGTGSAGGYLVPAPLSQTIIDVREEVGIARQVANIQPMTSDTMSMARRAGGLTVYYAGENTALTPSDKTWAQIELVAKKRTVAHQISQELQDDALISVVDDAVSEMAYALADKEDEEFINGDGTSTYGNVRGLLSAIGSAGVYTASTGDHDEWSELTLADFAATMGKLPAKYARQPVWLCSANFYWSAMVNTMANAGGNAILDLQSGDSGRRSFLGYPVYFSDKMPRTTATSQKCALFGTFSMGVILGDRTGIRVGRSDDYAFLNDMTTLKATSRYDLQVHAPGDTSNAGAYVALSTNS